MNAPTLSGTLNAIDTSGVGPQIALGTLGGRTAVRITVTGIMLGSPTPLGTQLGTSSRHYDPSGLPVYDGCAGNVSVNASSITGTYSAVFCDPFNTTPLQNQSTRLAYMDGNVTAQRAGGSNNPCQSPSRCFSYSGSQQVDVKPVAAKWVVMVSKNDVDLGNQPDVSTGDKIKITVSAQAVDAADNMAIPIQILQMT